MEIIINIILLLTLSIALYTDVTSGKIYNKLTFSIIILGLILNIIHSPDLNGIKFSFIGLFTGFIVFFPFYLTNKFAAGDVKLFCAIGALKGSMFVIYSIIFTFAGGFFVSLYILSKDRHLLYFLKNFIFSVFLRTTNVYLEEKLHDTNKKNKYPFTISICIGNIITSCYFYFGWNFLNIT